MIELDQSVLAYASASYVETAVIAAAKDVSALERMVKKIEDLKRRYGKSMLKHAAIIGLVSATIAGIIKALDNPVVADKVAEVSGKLKAVTGLAMLGASLYGLVTGLLDMITPEDEGYNTPSMRQRLDALAQKNERLDRALQDVHNQMLEHERSKGKDLGKEHVADMRNMRKANRQEKAAATRAAKKPKSQQAHDEDDTWEAAASLEVTAFSFLQKQLPGSVTTRELYPAVHTYREDDSARFLQRIDDMSAQQRNNFARKLAAQPEKAQGFVDHVFAIVRRMRKDAVGQKVHKLGTFVVKWATIFAVQAIMFKMLVYVTKANVFNAIGGVTRFVMAGLCAVNSILMLVHTAEPEEQDHGVVQSIQKTANHSKKLLTKMSLSAA